MIRTHNELIFEVIENYLFHKNIIPENPIAKEMQDRIIDIDIDEMWMLTQ